jgi:hypothetical protein
VYSTPHPGPPETPRANPPAGPAGDLISPEAPGIPNHIFSDIDELKEHLQDWAGDHGFAISCTSSRGGDYYTMRCKRARGGAGGCPWTMVVRRFFFPVDRSPGGRLAWTTTTFAHNHPPVPRGTFAVHRRPSQEVREYIERAGERGEKPRVILNAVRRMEGCAEFDIDTVYYIVAQWRRRSRAEGVSAGANDSPVRGRRRRKSGAHGPGGAEVNGGPSNAGPSNGRPSNGEPSGSGRDPGHDERGRDDDKHDDDGSDERSGREENGRAQLDRSPGPMEIDPALADAPLDDPDHDHDPDLDPGADDLERTDARGRAKPWCTGCQSYIRHHGACPREQRKRKAAGESTTVMVDTGVQTEPLDIFKDPAFARQVAAILLAASESVKERAGL